MKFNFTFSVGFFLNIIVVDYNLSGWLFKMPTLGSFLDFIRAKYRLLYSKPAILNNNFLFKTSMGRVLFGETKKYQCCLPHRIAIFYVDLKL